MTDPTPPELLAELARREIDAIEATLQRTDRTAVAHFQDKRLRERAHRLRAAIEWLRGEDKI